MVLLAAMVCAVVLESCSVDFVCVTVIGVRTASPRTAPSIKGLNTSCSISHVCPCGCTARRQTDSTVLREALLFPDMDSEHQEKHRRFAFLMHGIAKCGGRGGTLRGAGGSMIGDLVRVSRRLLSKPTLPYFTVIGKPPALLYVVRKEVDKNHDTLETCFLHQPPLLARAPAPVR